MFHCDVFRASTFISLHIEAHYTLSNNCNWTKRQHISALCLRTPNRSQHCINIYLCASMYNWPIPNVHKYNTNASSTVFEDALKSTPLNNASTLNMCCIWFNTSLHQNASMHQLGAPMHNCCVSENASQLLPNIMHQQNFVLANNYCQKICHLGKFPNNNVTFLNTLWWVQHNFVKNNFAKKCINVILCASTHHCSLSDNVSPVVISHKSTLGASMRYIVIKCINAFQMNYCDKVSFHWNLHQHEIICQ